MSDAIKLAIDALEAGLDCAQEVAHRTHEELKGYKPHRHAAVDADVSKIEAALAALRAQPAGWMPIETAPKERTPMIVVLGILTSGYVTDPWCVWWQEDAWQRWPHKEAPTHWMPLPPPPGQGRAQPDHSEQHLEMVAAARVVVDRWDTPLWKDVPATAVYINRLRDALPAIGETME